MHFTTRQMAWISGWGSDISIWENEIYEHFPNFSHRFIDYFDLLPNPDDFWDSNPRLAEAGIVAGWSMGTLALLRNLSKKPKEQKWVLICPIADFCACWPSAAVRATKQGILKNTEQTLMSFFDLMGCVSKEEKEKWVASAMRYSPKQLAAGLDYLMQNKAFNSCSHLNFNNIELIFGKKDKVTPLAQKELFSSFSDKKIMVCENSGHWLPDYIWEFMDY